MTIVHPQTRKTALHEIENLVHQSFAVVGVSTTVVAGQDRVLHSFPAVAASAYVSTHLADLS